MEAAISQSPASHSGVQVARGAESLHFQAGGTGQNIVVSLLPSCVLVRGRGKAKQKTNKRKHSDLLNEDLRGGKGKYPDSQHDPWLQY